MKICLNLAKRAEGMTSPNPLVGALVVKGEKIVGFGFHKRAGLPHAEAIALDRAKEKAKGATLYVTLEPCSTYGKTPPCVDKILESKIKRVIIGMVDPNPINKRKGIRILKKNNIDVKVGFLEKELKKINESYIKYIAKKLPFVTVKVGQSLDGRIATKKGESKWITSKVSRDYAKSLRRFYDAIMVGVNTIIEDNPLLEQGAKSKGRRFFKIVVDSNLRIPLNAKILSGDSNVIIATTKNLGQSKIPAHPTAGRLRRKKLEEKGIMFLEVRRKNGRVNLRDLMEKLAKLEITNILVEGGGELIGSLFDENLVDKIMFFISPKIIGGKNAISSVEGEGIANLNKAIRLKDAKIKRIAEDILVEGYVK